MGDIRFSLEDVIRNRSASHGAEHETVEYNGKKELVYKSNRLIEGRYSLSAIAQKIAASVISRVDPTLPKNEPLPTFCMTIPELSRLTGVDRKVLYLTIRKYTRELKAIVIDIDSETKVNSYTQLSLFRRFYFDGDTMTLSIEFEELLGDHIRDFAGNFTRYQLSQLVGLKSRYAIRLYEILRKAHNMSQPDNAVTYYTKSVDDLRLMLGIEPNKYKNRFDSFRKNVIEKAQQEMADKTDLTFEFEGIRKNRKIDSLRFVVRNCARIDTIEDHKNPINGELLTPGFDEGLFIMVKQMIPHIPDDDAKIMVTGYDAPMLTEALLDLSREKARKAHNGEEPIHSEYAYLTKILKDKRKRQESIDRENLEKGGQQSEDFYRDLEFNF